MSRHATLLVLVVCAACATPPAAEPPPAQARLVGLQARGAALVRAGDVAGAARSYDAALRIATSLEDADAIAANALNLAAVYQQLGRDAEARGVLSIVVDDERRPFSDYRRLQAELRRAIVELALAQPGAAQAMAARAARRCGERCDYAATIANVQAEAALAGGNFDQALAHAQAALGQARSYGDRAEAANALRNLGRAQLAGGEAVAARPLLEQALEIDRALADPRKILADLDELSHAAAKGGDGQGARNYGERAAAVRAALQKPQSIGELETGLRRP